jgi:hypothetical protein
MSFMARHKLAILLCVIAVTGVSWIVWALLHNAARRLDQERFESHRDLWLARRPASYVLKYHIRLPTSDAYDYFEVRVVNHKTVEAFFNDTPEPADRLHNYGMERLFAYVERFLEMDEKQAKEKAQHFADFGADGRLLRYQRHLHGQSVEIEVEEVREL